MNRDDEILAAFELTLAIAFVALSILLLLH